MSMNLFSLKNYTKLIESSMSNNDDNKLKQLVIKPKLMLPMKHTLIYNWALENHHKNVIKILLDNDKINLSEDDKFLSLCRFGDEYLDIINERLGFNYSYDKAFINACEKNQFNTVKLLFTRGIINDTTYNESFILACSNDYLPIINTLINDVNINTINRGIDTACEKGYISTVKLLLDKCNNKYNGDGCKYAAKYNHVDIIKLLLARVNITNEIKGKTIAIASIEGNYPIIKLMYNNNNGGNNNYEDYRGALINASKGGYIPIIKLLLNINVDLSSEYNSSLIATIKNNHLEAFILLSSQLNNKINGNKILLYAVNFNRYEITKLILNNDNFIINNKDSLFIDACEKGYINIVKLLMNENNIYLSAELNYAFNAACKNNHITIVKLLLKDDRIDPLYGLSGIAGALEKNRKDIVKLLLKDVRIAKSPRYMHNTKINSDMKKIIFNGSFDVL